MDRIIPLTSTVSVAGSLSAEDFARLAKLGFRSVISNRFDGEDEGQLSAREAAVYAWRAGLSYRHVPAAKHEVFDAGAIEALSDAMAALPGPILLHCRSGQRSALLWAAASALSEPIDCVMAALARAGFQFEDLREDIAGLSGRKRWLGRPAALDCAA